MKYYLAIAVVILSIASVAVAGILQDKSAQAYAGACVDASSKAGTLSVPTGSSTTYDLPNDFAPYTICCNGARCFLTCDDGTPTATTTAGGYAFSVSDGDCTEPLRFGKDRCAFIGSGTGGTIEFVQGGIKCP